MQSEITGKTEEINQMKKKLEVENNIKIDITQKLSNATVEIVKINREKNEKHQKIESLKRTLEDRRRKVARMQEKNERIVEDNWNKISSNQDANVTISQLERKKPL